MQAASHHSPKLRQGSRTNKPPSGPPGKGSAAGLRRLTSFIQRDARKLRRRLRSCRRRPAPEVVHDLRINARRLMVWCELLIWLGADSSVANAQKELKRLFRALARLREAQVQLEFLRRIPASLNSPSSRCQRWLRRVEQRQSKRVRRRCSDVHPARLTQQLVQALEAGPAADQFRSVREVWRDSLGHWIQTLAGRVLQALGQLKKEDPETLHRLRIALKHLRYSLESLPLVLGARSPFALARIRRMQSLLGDIQDAEVLLAWLKDWAADHPRHLDELQKLVRWVDLRRASLIRRLTQGSDLKALPGLLERSPKA